MNAEKRRADGVLAYKVLEERRRVALCYGAKCHADKAVIGLAGEVGRLIVDCSKNLPRDSQFPEGDDVRREGARDASGALWRRGKQLAWRSDK